MTKEKHTYDIFKQPVYVGDAVAVSISKGAAAPGMTYGIVNKITPKGATIRNRWGSLQPILHFHKRSVKVPNDFVEPMMRKHDV